VWTCSTSHPTAANEGRLAVAAGTATHSQWLFGGLGKVAATGLARRHACVDVPTEVRSQQNGRNLHLFNTASGNLRRRRRQESILELSGVVGLVIYVWERGWMGR
jgi:hypothetical protein